MYGGSAGVAGSITPIYGQNYLVTGSYSPSPTVKMRTYLTLKDSVGSPIEGVPLKAYLEGTTTQKCSGTTDTNGLVTCDVEASDLLNLDIYATGGGPKSAELTVNFLQSFDTVVDLYLAASGDRKIAELGSFNVSLKDYSGSSVSGGTLIVKDQIGNTICAAPTSNGDAYCRVVGAFYPSSGKNTPKYDLSVDTNGAYQTDPIFFNDYAARNDTIYVGGARKYLPQLNIIVASVLPVEIRFFPPAQGTNFVFEDSVLSGFSFSGDVTLKKYSASGTESCAYTPSGTGFSISSSSCSFLGDIANPGDWFELKYNAGTPLIPSSTTQSYICPAGTITYLST